MTAAEFRHHLAWAPVMVASCHGIIDAADLLGSAVGLGARSLRLEDVATSDLASVDLLFLAAYEMGLGYFSDHERETLSFANASLVGGSRYPVVPALPVNDLVSALLVREFAARAATTSPPLAYHTTLEAIQRLTRAEFRARVLHMWESLRTSALAQRLPWPAAALDPVIKPASKWPTTGKAGRKWCSSCRVREPRPVPRGARLLDLAQPCMSAGPDR